MRVDSVCDLCLGEGWTCEIHLDEPWSGVVGPELGCEPACGGPGVVCRKWNEHAERARQEAAGNPWSFVV